MEGFQAGGDVIKTVLSYYFLRVCGNHHTKIGTKDNKCEDFRVVKPCRTFAYTFHAFPDTLVGVTFASNLHPKLTCRSSNRNFINF